MNTCVCCGAVIPEGRQVCPQCDVRYTPDAILPDGRPLYFKTSNNVKGLSLQLELYEMMLGYKRAVEEY